MFGGIFGLIALVAAIWVIYDVLTQQKKFSDTEKLVWVIAAVLFSIITAIVYYLMKKRK